MNFKLNNKVILLTGAGKGIGKEILNLLIKEKVIIYAITRNKQDFRNIKKRKNLFLISGDITNENVINEIFFMDGYGLYVWSAFSFTLISFLTLFLVIKVQYKKEKNKFIAKFGSLNAERAAFAKSQNINKEILSNTSNI